MLQGLEVVRALQARGTKIDFYSAHVHRPFGVWLDPRAVYQLFDAIAKENVRVHVSEFFVPLPHEIIGPIMGGEWTKEKQADYYRRMFAVFFSHPAVDLVNLWGIGPYSWQEGSALMDKNYNPYPAYFAVKDLITHQFHTDLAGKVPVDGVIPFRGFHGAYEITVTLPDGRTATGTFSAIPPAEPTAPAAIATPATQTLTYRFRLDADGTALQAAP